MRPAVAKAMAGSLRPLTRSGQRLVESVGNAPTSACLQGKCIACLPRPRKLAGCLRAARSELSFGDSAAC
jgi:hypothetical protein